MSTNSRIRDTLGPLAALVSKARSTSDEVAHRRAMRLPHIGKKEQERAKRCYMSKYHSGGCGALRSTPTLCQDSKRIFETPF